MFRPIFASLSFFCLALHTQAAIDYVEILKQSDAARGNLDGVQWVVTVFEGEEAARKIKVKAKGYDMVAETLAPARQKGHKLLLAQNNMWFYKPGLSKPVPISMRQKLSGSAANGDVASTNYAEGYTILSVESGEHAGTECYIFDLEAKRRTSTYARIRYWVSKEDAIGLRADYFNQSGEKRLKSTSMRYANQVEQGGINRPFISELSIKNDLDANVQTTLRFSEPTLAPLPARTFSLQALTR